MLRSIALLFAAAGALSQSAIAQPLADQNFEVTQLYGKPVQYEKSPSLAFGLDGRVSGRGGCNNYGAEYSTKAVKKRVRNSRRSKARTINVSTVRFRNISSTRMYCGPGSMVEGRFFSALRSARRYVLKDGSLTIYGARGRAPIMTLTKVAM
jgi:putative lipoprotein